MNKTVSDLVEMLDRETKRTGSRNTLVLLGDRGSRYLQAVENRAKELGLHVTRPDDGYYVKAVGTSIYVFDKECKNPIIRSMAESVISNGYDIDSVFKYELSCCAAACIQIIMNSGSSRSMVAISGRGHSVRGLYSNLAEMCYSPFMVHSKSTEKDMNLAAENADILVNASDRVKWERKPNRFCLILDVCGSLADLRNECQYIGPKEIGALNVSILLSRFSTL